MPLSATCIILLAKSQQRTQLCRFPTSQIRDIAAGATIAGGWAGWMDGHFIRTLLHPVALRTHQAKPSPLDLGTNNTQPGSQQSMLVTIRDSKVPALGNFGIEESPRRWQPVQWHAPVLPHHGTPETSQRRRAEPQNSHVHLHRGNKG